MFFLEKKAPGRAAPHRRPSWGCTKTNPEWKCSNLFQIYFKLTLDLHGSIFRKSSENLDDVGLGCGRVPKIIPMQVQGGLRGPSHNLVSVFLGTIGWLSSPPKNSPPSHDTIQTPGGCQQAKLGMHDPLLIKRWPSILQV